MELSDILTPDRCLCKIQGVSKKRLLKTLSTILGESFSNLDENQVFDSMMTREQLGSTGIGNGIAIPHCRVPECNEITGCLITLETYVDYDSTDGKPVDLIFVLIVPEEKEEDHIKTLAVLAEKFHSKNFCDLLRNAQNNDELYHHAISHKS